MVRYMKGIHAAMFLMKPRDFGLSTKNQQKKDCRL